MKADLTRTTFSPFKHFARVIMQQGRVELDADWNEQAAILLHALRAVTADLVGPQGGPADDLGFVVSPLAIGPAGQSTPVPGDFRVSLGHYYVDGILCEAESAPVAVFAPATQPPGGAVVVVHPDCWTLDGAPFQANQYVEGFDDSPAPAFSPTVMQITNADQADLELTLQGVPQGGGQPHNPKLRRVITYSAQPDYPSPPPLGKGVTYQIYLDVWERLITYVEDDSIREVALGGPDTAARSKLVWQVKTTTPCPGTPQTGGPRCCTPAELRDRFQWDHRGRLKARAKQAATSTDPCIIPPDARYRGPENQLYRVEIHRGGAAWDGSESGKSTGATFKWSRENGSVIFPIVSIAAGSGTTTVTLETLGRDDRLGLAEGQWAEVQDDAYVLQNRAETLLQVQSIDRTGMTVTLDGVTGSSVGQDTTAHPLLRRWDQAAGDPAEGGLQLGSDNAALIVEDSSDAWLELEDGVQIQFQKPDPGQPPTAYRTGDYWLIPARTATGDVEWPMEQAIDPSGNPVTVPIARPPAGVYHHYAPLALITVDANGNIAPSPIGCQKRFSTLVELTPQ
jgi:hypothetical protein